MQSEWALDKPALLASRLFAAGDNSKIERRSTDKLAGPRQMCVLCHPRVTSAAVVWIVMRSLLKAIAEAMIARPHFRGRGRIVGPMLRGLSSVRSHYGVELDVNFDDATNRYSILGLYGDFVSGAIATLPRTDAIFLDIGANAGLFSLLASKRLCDGVVFALEPNPVVYRQLLRNVELNATKNVVPLHLALAEQADLFRLTFDPGHSGVSRLVLGTDGDEGCGGGWVVVPGFPMDSLSFIRERVGDRPVYAKIDVEGYEFSILEMLFRSSLAPSLHRLIVEIDSGNLARFSRTVDDIYSIADGAGFVGKLGCGHAGHYDELFVRKDT